MYQVDSKKQKPGTLNHTYIKLLVNFGRMGDMIWTQIRFCYILIFCHSKTSHSFLRIHRSTKKRHNHVSRGNMNMDVSPKSGNYAIGRKPNFSASISHTCEKKIKQKEPLNGAP